MNSKGIWAVWLLISLVATACGAASPSPAASAGPVKVRLGQVGGVSDAAIFIADEKGYFREQGIDLERTPFDTAADMVGPLGTGQLEVGAGAPGAGLLNAIASQVPLKIVADKGRMDPGHGYEAMVVRKALWDQGVLKSPADLKGRKIAIASLNISTEVALDTFLRTGGLTVKDVDVIRLPHADMASALANGSIDMGLPIEPFVTQIAERKIGVIWKRNDEVVPKHQVAVILYSPKFTKDQPEAAKKFMLAYIKAARYYNDAFGKNDAAKKQDVVAILVRNTKVKDVALYDKMAMPGIDPNGKVNVDSLASQQEWYLQKGSQKARVDLKKVVDMSYADLAVQKLGAYK